MQPQIQLVIQLTPSGQITVNGPIDNKLLCYGLLETAKDAIRDHKPEQHNGLMIVQGDLP